MRVRAHAWTQEHTLLATDALSADQFGLSDAMSGSTVVVGDQRNSGVSPHLRKAHGFELTSPPTPTAYCTAGTAASGCSATLLGVGTPSTSQPDGLELVAMGVDGARARALICGVNGPAAIPVPGKGRWRCTRAPPQRLGAVSSSSGARDS